MKPIVFILIIGLLASCDSNLDTLEMIKQEEEASVETGKDVEIFYSKKGVKEAQILAPVFKRFQAEEPYTEFTEGLTIYFYNSQMEVTSTLTAGYGKAYEGKDELFVKDDVLITNKNGKQLNSEELTWKQKDAMITSDKFVKITTPEEIIWGDGFWAKEDFSEYEITNVQGHIFVEDDEASETQ